MRVQLFIGLLVLAGAAFAQELVRIEGAANPEAIPEWTALDSLLIAITVDERASVLLERAGISQDGIAALRSYKAAKDEEARADDLAHPTRERAAICTRGLSPAQIAEKRGQLEKEFQDRRKARTEGAYQVLSADDAAKLRALAKSSRSKVTSFGVRTAEIPQPTQNQLNDYLTAVCGRAP